MRPQTSHGLGYQSTELLKKHNIGLKALSRLSKSKEMLQMRKFNNTCQSKRYLPD
jgi:hypothetical protein